MATTAQRKTRRRIRGQVLQLLQRDAAGALAPSSRRRGSRRTVRWAACRLALAIATLAGSVAIAWSAPPAPSEERWLQVDAVPVRPGAVVRWPGGSEVEACWLDQVPASLLDGACLFPVDLVAEGQILAERQRGAVKERVWLRVGEYPYPVQHIRLQSDRHVNLSDADGTRAAAESKRIAAVFERRSPRRFELPLGPPLAKMPQGGRFGSRRFFNGEPRSPHTGADYVADRGTPVLATASGVVVLAEEHFFGGKSVFLDHGDGLVSMALHLSQIMVEPGQEVQRGEAIGKVGSTGRSTGPHLHFGLRWRGARVDPAQLLEQPTRWSADTQLSVPSAP